MKSEAKLRIGLNEIFHLLVNGGAIFWDGQYFCLHNEKGERILQAINSYDLAYAYYDKVMMFKCSICDAFDPHSTTLTKEPNNCCKWLCNTGQCKNETNRPRICYKP